MVVDEFDIESLASPDEYLVDRETKLLKTVAAIQEILKTKEWSTLKELEFDGLKSNLERQILVEAKQTNPDSNKLNRLAGELKWAERFSDFKKWEQALRVELTNVRQNLHGTPKENLG